jgi:hypothetical protein
MIYNRNQGHYSDLRICEMVTLNEFRYNPEPLECLFTCLFTTKIKFADNIVWKIICKYLLQDMFSKNHWIDFVFLNIYLSFKSSSILARKYGDELNRNELKLWR